MNYNPNSHYRRSIRLQGYDYTQAGVYFITLCVRNHVGAKHSYSTFTKANKLTKNASPLHFGNIKNGEMRLNKIGSIIDIKWKKIPIHFKNIILDQYIIMPDHMHGIIILTGETERAKHFGGTGSKTFITDKNASPLRSQSIGTKSGSLSAIIQNFSSVTTRKINKIRKTPVKKFWQRNYYEHIVRNERELNRIRHYIINNPIKWEMVKNPQKNNK